MGTDDVTRRPLVQVTESEPPAHMAREIRVAQAELRPARTPYANVPLTGHGVTLIPGYQVLENLAMDYLVPHKGELPAQPDRREPADARSLAQICEFDDSGKFLCFRVPTAAWPRPRTCTGTPNVGSWHSRKITDGSLRTFTTTPARQRV